MGPLDRFRNLIFALIALAIVSGIVVLVTVHPPAAVITIIPPPPSSTPLPSATPGPVKVYVTGQVANPGSTFTLPPSSRVEDAIKAAGGMTDDADIVKVNLAAFVRDGDQIDVPSLRASRSSASGSAADVLPTASGAIHINSATAADLQRLPGVGASMASRILDYRAKNGPFKALADLDKVPGIGPARIAQWKDLIVFD